MTVENLVSSTIAPLIEGLNTSSEFDLELFRTLLSRLSISEAWVNEMISGLEWGDQYHRVLLHSGENYEIVLAVWPVGTATLIHDHGSCDSFGMVRLLKGEMFNHLYHQGSMLLEPGQKMTCKPGDLIGVPKGLLHQMGNASSQQAAASLHVYSPAIVEVSYWDPKSLEPCH